MNYLTIAQRLAYETGSSSVPSSVTSQTGEYRRLVNWVASAWDDIQLERPDWFWMRGSFSFTTTASDYRYSSADAGIATRFGMWDTDSIRSYLTSTSDEVELAFLPYDEFRSTYMVGSQADGAPICCSVGPNLDLMIGPAPNGIYTVSGEYFKSPQTLSSDSDIPELPEQFHMAIVYRAMMLYARYEAAGEIYADAEANYKRFLRRIELNQLPPVDVMGTLA